MRDRSNIPKLKNGMRVSYRDKYAYNGGSMRFVSFSRLIDGKPVLVNINGVEQGFLIDYDDKLLMKDREYRHLDIVKLSWFCFTIWKGD